MKNWFPKIHPCWAYAIVVIIFLFSYYQRNNVMKFFGYKTDANETATNKTAAYATAANEAKPAVKTHGNLMKKMKRRRPKQRTNPMDNRTNFIEFITAKPQSFK